MKENILLIIGAIGLIALVILWAYWKKEDFIKKWEQQNKAIDDTISSMHKELNEKINSQDQLISQMIDVIDSNSLSLDTVVSNHNTIIDKGNPYIGAKAIKPRSIRENEPNTPS